MYSSSRSDDSCSGDFRYGLSHPGPLPQIAVCTLSWVYTCEPYKNETFRIWSVYLPCAWGEHVTNCSIVHERPFVFTQKTDKFQFKAHCMLTVRVWFTNLVHIYEHLVCWLYANGLVRKCVLAFRCYCHNLGSVATFFSKICIFKLLSALYTDFFFGRC